MLSWAVKLLNRVYMIYFHLYKFTCACMENVVLSIISYLRKKVVRFSLNILTSKNIHILMSYYAVLIL